MNIITSWSLLKEKYNSTEVLNVKLKKFFLMATNLIYIVLTLFLYFSCCLVACSFIGAIIMFLHTKDLIITSGSSDIYRLLIVIISYIDILLGVKYAAK